MFFHGEAVMYVVINGDEIYVQEGQLGHGDAIDQPTPRLLKVVTNMRLLLS